MLLVVSNYISIQYTYILMIAYLGAYLITQLANEDSIQLMHMNYK